MTTTKSNSDDQNRFQWKFGKTQILKEFGLFDKNTSFGEEFELGPFRTEFWKESQLDILRETPVLGIVKYNYSTALTSRLTR